MTTGTEPTPTSALDVELAVTGMTCASCAARIERRLNRMEGVTATVNYATEHAKVAHPPTVSPADLIAQVEAAGYTAKVVGAATGAAAGGGAPSSGSATADGADDHTDGAGVGATDNDDADRSLRQRMLGSIVLAVPVIVLSMVPAAQFRNWQWLALMLAFPVVTWERGRSTGRPGPTSATAPPPWTRSSRSACWPPSAGPCTPSSSATPG